MAVVWIIGGGSGIGAAVAKHFADIGWSVAISGRRAEKLAEVAAHSGQIRPYPLDVTDRAAIGAVLERIVGDLGSVDMFLFGAAAWQPMDAGDYDFEKFGKIVDTNLMGLVRMAMPVIGQMQKQGSGQFAVIGSVAGFFGLPRSAAYSATKAALISLLQTMRVELAPKGIAVRLIAPGFVKSELTAKNDFPMPFLLETDDAARRIVHGLTQSKRFEIAFPWPMVLAMKSLGKLPYSLAFWLTGKLVPKKV